ncbi:MAG: hypothetical protein EF813_04510 [Methanosarcinales archaeon]|nr:MAG: hypothetical protein EF813_04510 [Methanosarcinales archaeon]
MKKVAEKDTKPERVALLEGRIREIYAEYRHLLPAEYKWEDESSRWTELVYCIFAELTHHSYRDARRLANDLADLNLLEVEDLARIPIMDNGTINPDNSRVKTITDILKTNSVTDDDIKKSLSAICKVAQAIEENYDGKIQKFLRKYGHEIVDDFDSHVSFYEVSKGTQSRILVKWIQNTLCMPLAFSNVYTARFCERKGANYQELAEAADNLGINGAMLDDLLEVYIVDIEGKQT